MCVCELVLLCNIVCMCVCGCDYYNPFLWSLINKLAVLIPPTHFLSKV